MQQIEGAINSGQVRSHISEELHAVCSIGNVAAHSIKSTTTGAIVDVKQGEADWNVDVFELLFEFCLINQAF